MLCVEEKECKKKRTKLRDGDGGQKVAAVVFIHKLLSKMGVVPSLSTFEVTTKKLYQVNAQSLTFFHRIS